MLRSQTGSALATSGDSDSPLLDRKEVLEALVRRQFSAWLHMKS